MDGAHPRVDTVPPVPSASDSLSAAGESMALTLQRVRAVYRQHPVVGA